MSVSAWLRIGWLVLAADVVYWILVRIAFGVGFIVIAAIWLGRGENLIVGSGLLVSGVLVLAVGAYETGWEIWGRRSRDAVHSQESGFFVLTRGDRIAGISPAG